MGVSRSLERTRAGHVSRQCGRAGPPASLSSPLSLDGIRFHDIKWPVHAMVSGRMGLSPQRRSDILFGWCLKTEGRHDGRQLWHAHGVARIVSSVVLGLDGILLFGRFVLLLPRICKHPQITVTRLLTRALQLTGTRPWLRRSIVIFWLSAWLAALSVGCRSLSWFVVRHTPP